MIRINLLGRARPKAPRTAVPLEATLQVVFFMSALVLSFGLLYGHYWQMDREDRAVQMHIQMLTGEKARLEQLKQQVDNFENQKKVLQQRISVIETLQRNRIGGQALLEAIANTVGRADTVWLTNISRNGDTLSVNGSAGSIDAVANFITQLKRSGYFQQVEIKESHQDETIKAVQIFNFAITAQFALPATDGPPAPTASKISAAAQDKRTAGKT